MCTAITYKPKNFYFGRTLDAAQAYPAEIVVTPRGYNFNFAESRISDGQNFAMVGAALVKGGYPLYFDAMNERGLCMAGLNFIGNAKYFPERSDKINLAQFELIPYILGRCATAEEAEEEFCRINITMRRFSPALPPAELHWLVADKNHAFTAECTAEGMRTYKNEIGVLTNNPPFLYHMHNMANYIKLSADEPRNSFGAELRPYGAGFGAIGLPGDFSSASRFVRAAFLRANAPAEISGDAALGLFFHILGGVNIPRGACRTAEGDFFTQYSCCCDAENGTYCMTTYGCRAISAVNLFKEDLNGKNLVRYSAKRSEYILKFNY